MLYGIFGAVQQIDKTANRTATSRNRPRDALYLFIILNIILNYYTQYCTQQKNNILQIKNSVKRRFYR